MATGVFGRVKLYENMDVSARRFLANGSPVMPQQEFLAGTTFYVDSSLAASGDGRSPEGAKTTLSAALALCTANKGDKIIVMPNHAETITGAGGITASTAGVSIIGLGRGNQRPRFLMDAGTAVTFLISAADVYVENLVFASGHSGVVTCFNITAAHAWLYGIEFENNTTNENFLTCIKATSTSDNNADGLRVVGCRWITSDADDLEMIEINANLNGAVIAENFMCSAGTASPLILCAGTKVLSGALIINNIIQNANTSGDIFINNGGSTGQTGIVAYNLAGNLDTTGAQDFGAATGLQFFENYETSTSVASGGLYPAADTPTS